jgi:hypothetical protein
MMAKEHGERKLYISRPCPHHQQQCWQYQSVEHKAKNSPEEEFLGEETAKRG